MTASETEPAVELALLTAECAKAISQGDWEWAEALRAKLDQAPAKPPPSMLAAALWYAEQGLPVFPLRPGDKAPLPGSHGFLDASLEPGRIRAWWAADPDRNVGLATGGLVDVIDVDGPEGARSWARIPDLPELLGTVATPGDASRGRAPGTHLYVPATGDGCTTALWPGIDYRGRGGYVVAPPSIGPDGRRYRWRRPLRLAGLQP